MRIVDKQAKERYLERLKVIKEGTAVNPFETPEEKKAIIDRLKKDPAFLCEFIFPHYATSKPGWFHIRLAKAVLKNKKIRRLIRWGRGLAKSVWSDIIIPIMLWINGEDVFMVLVGNNLDKAEMLLSDVQAEFEANARLIHYFGDQFCRGSWEDGDFRTKDGRFIGKALGMGQSPRGLRVGAQRPNYIVCDDLEDKDTVKNPKRQDEVVTWIENDLLKTMDGDTARYLHPNNDPWPRSIQNRLEKRHPNWDLDEVCAYSEETFDPAWPEKYTSNYYREQEQDGALSARAEFNHKKHLEGKVYTDNLIQWGKRPRIDHFKHIVGFWDVAYSGANDYNAVKVWGLHGFNFWQLKAFVRQCKMNDPIRFMYEYQNMLPASILIHWRVEEQFWNDPLKAALKEVELEFKKPLNIVISPKPKLKKFDRLMSMHPYYQNGRVYYDDAEFANNDMQEGINQLKGIEPGYNTHDDSPDADEQAISYLSQFVVYEGEKRNEVTPHSKRRNNRM
jgi:phage terminase large subunit-like protein